MKSLTKQEGLRMFALHQSLHSQYGICLWTLLAVIVFLIMVVIFVVHVVRQRKRKYSYDRKLEAEAETKNNQEGQEV